MNIRHKCKVLSSGRLTGPIKLQGGKKRVALRKPQTANPSYSLYSTDSEDQVVVIHKGLDRCAALLNDILHNEDAEPSNLNNERPVSAKISSKQLPGKRNITKKRVPQKYTHSSHVHKEIVSLVERKTIPKHAATGTRERVSQPAEQNPSLKFVPIPTSSTQHLPVTQPGLCEHVQTQMSLMNGQLRQSTSSRLPATSCDLVSDQGFQGATVFNYRLPSSTPALSPQRPGTPAINQHIGEFPCAPVHFYNRNVPCGGALLPMDSYPVATIVPLQPVSTASQPISTASNVLTYVPSAGPSNPLVTGNLQTAFQPETPSKQQNPGQQSTRESEMLWRIQAQLNQLQQPNPESQWAVKRQEIQIPVQSDSQGEVESSGEQTEGTSSEENRGNGPSAAAVRDTSCQTSFNKNVPKTKKTSPQKITQKVNTVKYLLGEIKALIADQDDTEVQRLIAELEESVSLLPVVLGSTNIQAEIALTLQPLRSENAQLRRRLRILNQQLRERERAEKESRPPDVNFELISLRSMNITLQSQLTQSQKSLELLQGKNKELLKVINDQKEENKKVGKAIHEREQELLQVKQQAEVKAAKVKLDVEEVLPKIKSIQFKLAASEKENNILGITLRQRDAEVHRLRELTRTLQSSMAKLLSELCTDNLHDKSGKTLTKSVLEAFEKQQQNDQCSASISILSYLKKLENDDVLDNADSPIPEQIREANAPEESLCEYFIAPDAMLKKLTPFEDPTRVNENNARFTDLLSPVKSHSASNHHVNTKSDSGTLVGEGETLDETMYIPFAGSPSKARLAIPKGRGHSPSSISNKSQSFHHIHSHLKNNHKQIEESSPVHRKLESAEFTGNFNFKKKVPKSPKTMGCNTKLENWLPTKPWQKIKGFPAELSGKAGISKFAKSVSSSVPSQQPKDPQLMDTNSVCDSSFSTIDYRPGKTDWSMSSFSTFTSRDEQNFRDGLADLDANIAKLQKTLQANFKKKCT